MKTLFTAGVTVARTTLILRSRAQTPARGGSCDLSVSNAVVALHFLLVYNEILAMYSVHLRISASRNEPFFLLVVRTTEPEYIRAPGQFRNE